MPSRSTARSRTVAWIGAPLLLLGCAVYELVSIASGHVWPGFTQEVRIGLGLLDAALWLASAAILAVRTSKALYVPVYGALMLLTEAVVARAGGSTRELVYLAVLPLIVVLTTLDIRSVLGIGRAHVEAAVATPSAA